MSVPGHRSGREDISSATHFASLSTERQRLVRLVRYIHFGRIHRLRVVEREPLFDDQVLVLRTLKLVGGCEPLRYSDDACLGAEMEGLQALLTRLDHALIERIEIAHGKPMLVEVAQTGASLGDEEAGR